MTRERRDLFSTVDKIACFVLLNPSTADEHVLDPTLRRCFGFTTTFGANEMRTVNAFAIVGTDPKILQSEERLTFQDVNDRHILHAAQTADITIVGWGGNLRRFPERYEEFRELLRGIPVYTLEPTKDGAPKHPLYLKSNLKPIEFLWPALSA